MIYQDMNDHPITNPTFQNYIGIDGNGPGAHEIINGKPKLNHTPFTIH